MISVGVFYHIRAHNRLYNDFYSASEISSSLPSPLEENGIDLPKITVLGPKGAKTGQTVGNRKRGIEHAGARPSQDPPALIYHFRGRAARHGPDPVSSPISRHARCSLERSRDLKTRNKGCSVDRCCTFGQRFSVLSLEPGLDVQKAWRIFHHEVTKGTKKIATDG